MPQFSDIPYHIINKYFLDLLIDIEVKKRDKLFTDGDLLWEDVLFEKNNAREIYFKDMPESIPRENVLNIINMNWNLHYQESISYAKNSYLIGPNTTINAGKDSSEFKEYWVKTDKGFDNISMSLKNIEQYNNFLFERKEEKITDVYEIDVEISSNSDKFFQPWIKKRYIKKGNKFNIIRDIYTYKNIIDANITENHYHILQGNQVFYFHIDSLEEITINLHDINDSKIFINNKKNDFDIILKYNNDTITINTLDFNYKYLYIFYENDQINIKILSQNEIKNITNPIYDRVSIDDIDIGDKIISNYGLERVYFKHYHDEVILNDKEYNPTDKVYFRKDSYFYFWLKKYYPEYLDQVMINKIFLYFGPLYNIIQKKNDHNVVYYGLKDYVLDALPDINKPKRFAEFLVLYFDRIHQTVYQNTKEISSLMDPLEIHSYHLPELAKTFGIDLNKIRYDDFRLRQYIDNFIYFLKRKGTYTSLIIIWLLISTKNKLHIFDTYHNENIPLKDHYPYHTNEFVPFKYLTEKLNITSDFRKHIDTIDYYQQEEPPFIFKKETSEHRWNINHSFNSRNLLFYCYDTKFKQIVPAEISIIDNFNVLLYFNRSVSGWCFVIKPITINKNQLTQSTNNNYYYNYSFIFEYHCNNNDVVFVDSRNKDITIHLPKNPEHLTQCKIIDIYDGFMNNNVMIKSDIPKSIKSEYDNMILNLNGFDKTFIYLDNYGWTFVDSDLTKKNNIKIIDSDFISKRNDILFIDARDNGINILFPKHPSTYDQIKIIDIYDSFSLNDVFIDLNGEKIENNDIIKLKLNTTGIDKTFIYLNPDTGWIILDSNVLVLSDIKTISHPFYQSIENDILLLDTRDNEIQINLPPTPLQYDQVKIIDFYNNFSNNNVNVNSGTNKINSYYDNIVLNLNGFDKTFIYVDSHVGWRYIESSLDLYDLNRCIDYTKFIRLYDDELIALHKNRMDVMVHMQDTSHKTYKPMNIKLDNGLIKITNNGSMKDHFISYTTSSYRYVKENKEQEWKIYHYLNKRGVICQCYDVNMNVIYPKEVILVSDNICTIKFEEPESGYVNIKPITSFDMGPDDIKLSTHYVLEMNLNEEPMDINSNKILSSETINGLYDSWESLRPVTKSSHYRVLLSPNVNMKSVGKNHYNRTLSPNFFTSCKIENVFEYDTYTHKQVYYNDVWNITHDLSTNHLLYSFYNEEHIQVFPRLVENIDKNSINVYFYQQEKGYCLIMKADSYEKKDVRNEEWIARSPFRRNVIVDITDLFHNNRFYPKTIKINKNEYVHSNYNKEEVGYLVMGKSDYTHNQITPQKTWRVNHNLVKGVICQCYEWYNEVIYPKEVKLIDDVTCEITFDRPWCGYVNVKSINSLIYEDELFDYLENSTFRIGIKGSESYDKKLPINVSTNDIEHEIYRGNIILHRVQSAVYIHVNIPINAVRNDKDYNDYDFPMTELGIFNREGKMLFYSYFNEIFKPRDVSMLFLFKTEYED